MVVLSGGCQCAVCKERHRLFCEYDRGAIDELVLRTCLRTLDRCENDRSSKDSR